MSGKRKKSVLKDDDINMSDYTTQLIKEFDESENENLDEMITDKDGDKDLASTPCIATLGCLMIPCFFCVHFHILEVCFK